MRLIDAIKKLYNEFPAQYWFMITGVVLSTAGGSMNWPFLIIYASDKLNMLLSSVAALISINGGIGLIFSLIAGTLADKIGRKLVRTPCWRTWPHPKNEPTMNGFWGFWLSMVIITFGELASVPTASKYVVDLAPAELRGRYMAVYWLGWGLARTISPLSRIHQR
jgi:MFS family permease